MPSKLFARIERHIALFSHDIAKKWRAGDAQTETGNPRVHLFPQARLAIEDFNGIELMVMRDEPIVSLMRYMATHDDQRILNTVIDALNAARDVIHIDVGTNYGLDLCYTAKRILARHSNAHIAGFDPGAVRDITPHNLALNDLQDKASFFPMACAHYNGFIKVYGEAGHSENNRIVNPMKLHTTHTLAPCTTLDSYVEALDRKDAMIFMKIDTQGAEPEVFAGAKAVLRSHHCVIITEFSPTSIASRHDAAGFLRQLAETHDLYDLGYERDRFKAVGEDYQAFAKEIEARPEQWADLLLLPKSAPDFSNALAKKLAAVV